MKDNNIELTNNAGRVGGIKRTDSSNYDDEDNPQSSGSKVGLLTCSESGCRMVFTNESSFADHYQNYHRFVCSQCKRHLSSNRLLDIHIAEHHDPFFDILSTRKPMYVCFMENCPETLANAEERKNHMINVHHYPPGCSFDYTLRKHRKQAEECVKETSSKKTTNLTDDHNMPNEVRFGDDESEKGFITTDIDIRKPWNYQKRSVPTASISEINMKDMQNNI